ncbi:MAG: MATE family efflux transporter, partial [Gemmatimonadota bacterium]|nr:MATE family efflux transporter [Gemmatimonadota bacterium]
PLGPREGLAPVPPAPTTAQLVGDSLPRTIVRIALPAIASTVLMTVFTSIDTYWVGTRVGADGLAAVSTSVFWIWLVVSIAEMVSIGLTAVAARRYGEGRREEGARTAGDALVFALAVGALVAVIGLFALEACFAIMHTPPEVTALGLRYLGTYLVGAPLIFGFFVVDAAFRASGDSRTPFVLLATSVVITLVLDPVLIMGLAGAPRLGVMGAAIATVTTRAVAFTLGLVIAVRRGLLRVGRPRLRRIAALARVGLPTAATGVLFSLVYVVMTRTTTQFGTPALAALGIGHRVESWLFMIGVGAGAATAAVVGQNLGARRPDRAERAGWLAVAFCTALGGVICVLELAIPEWFAGIFSNDAAVIAEGASYLRIVAISQLFVCAEIVLEGALGGAGDTVPPMLTSTTITLARIPLAAWAAATWGSSGIWWVISLTAIARALGMIVLWRAGRWKRKSL